MSIHPNINPYVAAAALLASAGCAKLTIAWADLTPDGQKATPEILEEFEGAPRVETKDQWINRRAPALRAALQTHVYGKLPDEYSVNVVAQKLIDDNAFNGAGRLTEYTLVGNIEFDGVTNSTEQFYMNVVAPSDRTNSPVILMQTFCPRWDTIPHPGITRPEDAGGCGGDGFGASLATYIFGRYIATPPIETILKRGYAIATIFPSEFVPDNGEEGLAALKVLSAGMPKTEPRWGAIAAWAAGYSLMIDALEEDDAGNFDRFIAYGHSRYGKSALLAAAFDDRINSVVSHQSGTGGASLNRRKKGESVSAITQSYPHWFAEKYASYAGNEDEMPIDQHHLLALIAPRPVLLGNARRDVWSDPNGAFRAALGADPAYELFGVEGLDQERLDTWNPDAELSFWIRPGTHGVVKEDWPAFLEFLDSHFARSEIASAE